MSRTKSKSSRLFMEYNGLSNPDSNPYLWSRCRLGQVFFKYGTREHRKGLPEVNGKTSIKNRTNNE